MAKRRKPHVGAPEKSLLALRLEAGKPIKGMTGYVPLYESKYQDNRVYVLVECLGLKTGSDECKLAIQVKIMSGLGVMEISPCEWIDSLDQVAAIEEDIKAEKAYQAAVDNVLRKHYLVQKHHAFVDYVNNQMTPEQRSLFIENYEEVTDRTITKKDGEGDRLICTGDLKRLATPTFEKIVKNAIAHVHGRPAIRD